MNTKNRGIESGALYDLRGGALVKVIRMVFEPGFGFITAQHVTRNANGTVYHDDFVSLCADGFYWEQDPITGIRQLSDFDIVRVAEFEHPQLELDFPPTDETSSAVPPAPGKKKRVPRRRKAHNGEAEHHPST